MWQHLESERVCLRRERDFDPEALLPHYTQTEIVRIVAQVVLDDLG